MAISFTGGTATFNGHEFPVAVFQVRTHPPLWEELLPGLFITVCGVKQVRQFDDAEMQVTRRLIDRPAEER